MYGIGGARISAQDGCTVRIDPDGSVVAATGVTEQGQGTEAIIRQIVAEAVGVPIDAGARHHRRHADHALRRRHLGLPRRRHRRRGGAAGRHCRQGSGARRSPAPCCRRRPTRSTSSTARSSTKATGQSRMPLAELGRIVYFRGDTLPPDLPRELMQTRHFITKEYPVRLHQRRAGLLARGRRRHRHGASCSSTGASRTAAASSTRCWSTSRCAAASCRASAARSTSTASTRPRAS